MSRTQILQQLADGGSHPLNIPADEITAALAHYGLSATCKSGKWQLNTPIDWLDANAIHSQLSASTQQRLNNLQVVLETASTNDYLLAEADTKPAALLAEYQSAGRGRRHKRWQAPLGSSLLFSLRWPLPPQPAALTLAAGLAVCQALETLGAQDIQLKWPNDVQYRGQKIAGILAETRGDCVILGVGLNVALTAAVMQSIEQDVTDCRAIFTTLPSRNSLAAAMLEQLVKVFTTYTAHGFTPFLNAWQAHDALFGQPINVLGLTGKQTGEMVGIDAEGALLLRTTQGIMNIHSGEVSIRPAS